MILRLNKLPWVGLVLYLTMVITVSAEEHQICNGTGSTVAILVDPLLVNSIRSGLSQFENDLCIENYTVIEKQSDFVTPPEIRDYLAELYNRTQKRLVGAILIGDIPYAYQWIDIENTIPPRREEIISYQYYCDLDGTFRSSPGYVSPGGNIYSYDIHTGNVDWEIWIGVFPLYKGDLQRTGEAINRYFLKNHAYRVNREGVSRGFLEIIDFGDVINTIEENDLLLDQYRLDWSPLSDAPNARIYFESPPAGLSVDQGYSDLSAGVADFTVLRAHGSSRGSGKIGIPWAESNRVGTIFFYTCGCSAGDLDYADNVLTSVLYSPTSDVLVALGMTDESSGMGHNANGLYSQSIASAISKGASFGQAILDDVNMPLIFAWESENREYFFAPPVILGDPTLVRLLVTISEPKTPVGPSTGIAKQTYYYNTGGSTSSLGDSVQYQFDWKGDESDLSSWGPDVQGKFWSVSGTYSVRARARGALNTYSVSNWSSPLLVSISIPKISVTPTAHDFGNVKVKRSKTASFSVRNKGTGNLLITSIITGTDAAMFTITSGSGTATISPGKSLTIKVAFNPTFRGSKGANLEITSNDPITPIVDIPLSGAGQ